MDGSTRSKIEKAYVKQLEKRLAAKKREAANLQQQNSQLHTRHSILLAYCNSLAWLRDYTWDQLTEDPLQQQQQQQFLTAVDSMRLASADELLLLEQLGLHPLQQQQQAASICHDSCYKTYQNCSNSWLPAGQQLPSNFLHSSSSKSNVMLHLPDQSAAAAAAAAAAAHPTAAAAAAGSKPGTVSPDNDFLALFRHVHAMPAFPGAAHMTLEQLAAEYNDIVRDLSLNLVLFEAHSTRPPAVSPWPSPSDRLPLDNIKAAFDRYFNLVITLLQLRRSQLIISIGLLNYANPTGGLLQEPNVEEHRRAVASIGLSLQQQQQIAEGMAVFSRLLEPVLQELRQLQLQDNQQQQQLQQHNNSSSNSTSSGTSTRAAAACQEPNGSNGSGSSSDSSIKSEVEDPDHREQLYQQEQRTLRMEMLMQKDVLIKAAFVSYTYGRFSYPQLGKLHCIMYPYNPHHATVVRVVVQQLEQAKQQQQQGEADVEEEQQQQAEEVVRQAKQQQQAKQQLQKRRRKKKITR